MALARRLARQAAQWRSRATRQGAVGVRHHSTSGQGGDRLAGVPSLREFLSSKAPATPADTSPQQTYLAPALLAGQGRKVFFETYGCQMNVNDTEIVWAILNGVGYERAADAKEADVVFLMTCAIRENAEQRVWTRLDFLKHMKKTRRKTDPPLKVGVLGCMAERLKTKLLEADKMVDLVVGPDAYRDLPRLLSVVEDGHTAANVQLSLEETYADIAPVRLNPSSTSAYVSIMRGCDNMCSYCIVPFTRGRERSRPMESVLDEIRALADQGVKEVILLGQNVNSYRDLSASSERQPTVNSKGFRTVYKNKLGGARFTELMDRASLIDPEMRIRFTSPHPKDFPDDLLHLIAERPNLCKQIHLPAQSGSTAVLERMRRGYTREAYLELVDTIRTIIPGVALSSDFISGFCGETEEDHVQTVDLVRRVGYDMAFLFAYSLREKTHAHRAYVDDVPEATKLRRLQEVIEAYRVSVTERHRRHVGTTQLVLVEKVSRRSDQHLVGRADNFLKVILPKDSVPCRLTGAQQAEIKPGDYVEVRITDSNMQTLRGLPVARTSLGLYAQGAPPADSEMASAGHT